MTHQLNRNLFSRGRHKPDVPDSPLMEQVQEWILKHNVEHLHGPEEVHYDIDELVVLVLLRNGRPYIKPFIEHYFSIGVKHIVFLDNGSTDGTVEALKAYDEHITVFRSGLSFKKYNLLMKRYLVERFGRGRWTLSVDIDELFDYPYSDVVSLKDLLRYLNEHSYTAVVTYMLDMFPEMLLPAESPTAEYEDLKERHRFYDISDVRTWDYNEVGDIGNAVSNEEIKILQGGVQRRLFNIGPLLIKHPLLFLDEKLKPFDMSDHWAGNARIADFTAVFLHYKISANLYGLVRKEIEEERRYTNLRGKYDKYYKVLKETPSLPIRNETSKELKSVNDLVGTRFVSVSRQYMNFVEEEERREKGARYSEQKHTERLFEAFFNARSELKVYNKKVRNLEQQLKKLRTEVKEPPRNNRARASRSNAEVQLREIQSSRTWKVFTMVVRLNIGVRSVLGRLRRRGLRREG